MKSRDWGLGIGNWGLAAFLTVALAGQMGRAEEMHEITVRVFNYAEVSSATLAEAEGEGTRIFERVGLAVAWVDCRPPAGARRGPPSARSSSARPTSL